MPTPMPIPALAPVDRPLLLDEGVEVGVEVVRVGLLVDMVDVVDVVVAEGRLTE
jgi:hypothetical protein